MARIRGSRVDTLTDPTTKLSGDIKLDKGKMDFLAVVNGEEVYSHKDGDTVRKWLSQHLASAVPAEWRPVIEVRYNAPRELNTYRREQRAEAIVAKLPKPPKFPSAAYDDAVEKALKQVPTHEWEESDDYEESPVLAATVSIELRRYYIGVIPNGGTWRKVPWMEYDPALAPGELMNNSSPFTDFDDRKEGPTETLELPAHKQEWNSRKSYLPYDEGLWAGLTGITGVIVAARNQLYELASSADGFDRIAQVGAAAIPLALPAST